MSLDATRWAWKQDLSPTRKLVLLALADRAGEKHQCYPSIARLEADTGLYRETIMEAIAEMQAGKILGVTKQLGRPSIYQLLGVEDRHEKDQSSSRQKPTPTSLEKPTGKKNEPVGKSRPHQSGKADTHQSAKADTHQSGKADTESTNVTDQLNLPGTVEEEPAATAKSSCVAATIKDDWKPSERCLQLAEAAGTSRAMADSLIGEFILYWQGRREKRPGWDSTFLNHCKRQAEKNPATGGQRPGKLDNQNSGGNYATRSRTSRQTKDDAGKPSDGQHKATVEYL